MISYTDRDRPTVLNWRSAIKGLATLLTAVVAIVIITVVYYVSSVTIKPDQDAFFDSDGYSIHYKVWGNSGKPIVLVHGWGIDMFSNWELTGWVKALVPHRRVIALDVLGHGASDKPQVQSLYSYVALSKDVVALMDHLGIDKADLLGTSMGAFMGEALLISHQDRFTSMILNGIGDEVSHAQQEAEMIAAALREPDADDITDPLGQEIRFAVDWLADNDNEAMALSALQMWPESFPMELGVGELGKVKIPVLIINGADDYYQDTADVFAAAIPGAQLKAIPDTDHGTVIYDRRFIKAGVDFLTAQD